MQPNHHALSTLFIDLCSGFFTLLQDHASCKDLTALHKGLAAFDGMHTVLSPAFAWQCLQNPGFVSALPATVSAWLRGFDLLGSLAEQPDPLGLDMSSRGELLMSLRTFWFHVFAWHLPRLSSDVALGLASLYGGDFSDPRVLVALSQADGDLSVSELNALYETAGQSFHAYRLPTSLHLAGWCHGLALALHIPGSARSQVLNPFLVNALKAAWNDSEQQRFFVHTVLAAMPADYVPYAAFRQVYQRFMRGRKALDQVRRTEDRLYAQWQQRQPLKPLIQKALQDLLHQGQVGSVFVFVRHDQSYTPLHLDHTPYAYREEDSRWCWRSHANFSRHNARDQREKLAHQCLQEALNGIYQRPLTERRDPRFSPESPAIRGPKAVQSRWWPAGESLLIAALYARRLAHDVQDLLSSPDLLWCKDAVLLQTFMDGCERMACEHRAGLEVSTELRDSAQKVYQALMPLMPLMPVTPHRPFSAGESEVLLQTVSQAVHQAVIHALMDLSLEQVQQALASLAAESLPLYLCWARRQSAGIPIDGFCQPLMYENDGSEQVPAVILWGEVHRAPEVALLPFVSRLHMYEIAPLSDLMRYWASDALLQWRQDLNRLRVQQQQKDEEYQRIQQAFEKIRQCREQENLAWAALRNQLDPPELLAYGVASNYALQQSYTRLHRPEQIDSPAAFLCFLAELSTGAVHDQRSEAEDTLKQLRLRAPNTLLAELFHYWQQLPPEQQTLNMAQSLFNYCKMIVHDGSQVESQLPGVLSLAHLTYTFHRMADYANTLGKRLQRQCTLPLQLHWQGHVFHGAQLHLHRMLRKPDLQRLLMGEPLMNLQDTRHVTPCFSLGQEQLALGFMEGLYALYATHFSPALQDLQGQQGLQRQRLWVKRLHVTVESQGVQLRLILSGALRDAARQKIAQTGPQSTHDLRRVLHHLRESIGVSPAEAWFFNADAEPIAYARSLYFCEQVGHDKHTELVVNLPL